MDDGKLLKPSAAEVRAITDRHAEKILELLDGIRELDRTLSAPVCIDRARVEAEVERLKKEMTAAVEKYAASFGEEAAHRLEAYARRQQNLSIGRAR